MPAVLVHGVPDTHRVWRALAARLRRADVIALSLPGFGCELPAGFDRTKDAYARWLLAELSRIEGPIDLVGHDWGGLLVVRAVSLEPALVRTLAVGAAPLDPEEEWHKAAQLDDTMKRSILALYRSAIRVGFEWVDDLQRAPARGLILWGANDPYAAPEFGRHPADRTRARFVPFAGCSHWWQLERAGEVANELEAHWR